MASNQRATGTAEANTTREAHSAIERMTRLDDRAALVSFIERDQISWQPDKDKHNDAALPPRGATLLRDQSGAPVLAERLLSYIEGPRRRPMVEAVRRLQQVMPEEYDVLWHRFAMAQSEQATAEFFAVSRTVVRERARAGVGFLHGCLATDETHARMRRVGLDELYAQHGLDGLDGGAGDGERAAS